MENSLNPGTLHSSETGMGRSLDSQDLDLRDHIPSCPSTETIIGTSTAMNPPNERPLEGADEFKLSESASNTSLSHSSPAQGFTRALSTVSSMSSLSARSTTSSRLSDGGISVKKRGFNRPQATTFAESAKNRESVMSLGSIAHLQYYFARTGLLDGKGGQLAPKDLKLKPSTDGQRSMSLGLPLPTEMPSSPGSAYPSSETGAVNESPVDIMEDPDWDQEIPMLPPTVSTYNQRPSYVPPPPDLTVLRRELTEALEDALKVLKESDKAGQSDAQGWYEIQGLHLLDITTLAIRAAKNYYTAHSRSARLHSIRSERAIRHDLYQVLDVLKRMAARNFAGGLRQAEKVGILTWIVGISELIQAEIDAEKREAEERERWAWRRADGWAGRDVREREHAFLKCFVAAPAELPAWTAPGGDEDLPSEFLRYCADGTRLVELHNALVAQSRRRFEAIAVWHTDVAKPYRRADNLRFWMTATRRRWDVDLAAPPAPGEAGLDVNDLVLNETPAAWRRFDTALLRWCRAVREELQAELEEPREGEVAGGRRMPAPAPPRLLVEQRPMLETTSKSPVTAVVALNAPEKQAEAGASEAAQMT